MYQSLRNQVHYRGHSRIDAIVFQTMLPYSTLFPHRIEKIRVLAHRRKQAGVELYEGFGGSDCHAQKQPGPVSGTFGLLRLNDLLEMSFHDFVLICNYRLNEGVLGREVIEEAALADAGHPGSSLQSEMGNTLFANNLAGSLQYRLPGIT
jgi:hypothetical protein